MKTSKYKTNIYSNHRNGMYKLPFEDKHACKVW